MLGIKTKRNSSHGSVHSYQYLEGAMSSDAFSKWKAFRFWFEKWHPILISSITSVAYFFFYDQIKVTNQKEILASITSVAGIAIGFISTSQSILLTIGSSRVVKRLRNLNRYQEFKTYLRRSLYLCFGLLIFSILGLLDLWHGAFISSMWIFILVLTGCSCFRAIHMFQDLLETYDIVEHH